ncbi:hypothetical protein, partial [Embleya sp. NPDC055610]
MITEYANPGALVLLADFVSPPAADPAEEATLRRWSEQAPRKLWLRVGEPVGCRRRRAPGVTGCASARSSPER